MIRKTAFGQRRTSREGFRRGTRPSLNEQTSTRRDSFQRDIDLRRQKSDSPIPRREGVPKGSPSRSRVEDAAFSPRGAGNSRTGNKLRKSSNDRTSSSSRSSSDSRYSRSPSRRPSSKRDNSSRFDD